MMRQESEKFLEQLSKEYDTNEYNTYLKSVFQLIYIDMMTSNCYMSRLVLYSRKVTDG